MSGLNFDWVSVYVHSAERPYFYRTPDELCFPHGVSVFHTVHPCIGRKAEVMLVHTRSARALRYGSRSGSVIDRRGGHASSQKTKLVSRTQLLAYQVRSSIVHQSPHTRVSVRVGTSQRSDPPRGLAPALHALQLPTRLLCIRDCAEMSHHVSHWSRFVTSRLASHAAAAASSNPPCSLASARSALRTSRGIAPEAPAMYTWQ